MRVAVPRESAPGECRVAATPDTVKKIRKLGFEVVVESGAGTAAHLPDKAFIEAGAEIATDVKAMLASADVVLKVNPPADRPDLGGHEVDLLRSGSILACFLWPAQNAELLERLKARGVTTVAVDQVPRISRAQKMDALSSMANIAGYRAVIEAAHQFGSFFPAQMTAAGKVPPCRVLVIGAGVAGLAAISAAKNLGAHVKAFDVRPTVADQVKSVGGEFLPLDLGEAGEGEGGYAKALPEDLLRAERKLFGEHAPTLDIIITTALIPGRAAPVLLTREIVESMKHGSVIVDLAAEQGGNCELTRPGEIVEHEGVRIIGYTDLTSRLPTHASQFYGTNLLRILEELVRDGALVVRMDDEVVRACVVTHEGAVTWPPPERPQPQAPPKPKPKAPVATHSESKDAHAAQAKAGSGWMSTALLVLGAVALVFVGKTAPDSFIQHLTVFVMACFVGWHVVWNVTPALHTPLMSVTNAISGIILIGGMLQLRSTELTVPLILGALAVWVAAINIFGGFLVTQRMLRMFRKE
jgi:NAD(P) transhydrogenase subunit alpha